MKTKKIIKRSRKIPVEIQIKNMIEDEIHKGFYVVVELKTDTKPLVLVITRLGAVNNYRRFDTAPFLTFCPICLGVSVQLLVDDLSIYCFDHNEGVKNRHFPFSMRDGGLFYEGKEKADPFSFLVYGGG